jgi:hypothetical protein
MKTLTCVFAVVLVIAISLPAWGDDQQKAEKELNKITALASDGTGRTVVNFSMAANFAAKRSDLVMERRDTGLNYGQIFVMHALITAGAKKEDIASQLKAGKNIFAIADADKIDWRQVGEEAKKLNSKIDQDLYQRLLDKKAGVALDQKDGYLLSLDGVVADNEVSKGDLNQAQERFMKQKDRADDQNHRANKLDASGENSGRTDNVRSGGPGGNKLPPTITGPQ